MKYTIAKAILIAGVVLGFGSGFAHLGARWAMHHRDGHGHASPWCSKHRDRRPERAVTPPAAPAPGVTTAPAL